MIKKLLQAIITLLAINFLVVSGAFGWLFQSHHLDKEKASAIREIMFPTSAPTTQPAGPETQPAPAQSGVEFGNLDELLRRKGQPASEQVEAVQRSIDAQSAELDRRRRELDALAEQLAREQKRLADTGAALEQTKQQLDERQQKELAKTADQGYQDSLKLYTSMPAAQVKKIFADLPEDAVAAYLQAMPPRAATKIIKEFKTKAELDLIHSVLERMRLGKPGSATDTKSEAKVPGLPKEDGGVIGPSGGTPTPAGGQAASAGSP